ncbi:unnamed protein product [Brassica rapa subsp. narinosa]
MCALVNCLRMRKWDSRNGLLQELIISCQTQQPHPSSIKD